MPFIKNETKDKKMVNAVIRLELDYMGKRFLENKIMTDPQVQERIQKLICEFDFESEIQNTLNMYV